MTELVFPQTTPESLEGGVPFDPLGADSDAEIDPNARTLNFEINSLGNRCLRVADQLMKAMTPGIPMDDQPPPVQELRQQLLKYVDRFEAAATKQAAENKSTGVIMVDMGPPQ